MRRKFGLGPHTSGSGRYCRPPVGMHRVWLLTFGDLSSPVNYQSMLALLLCANHYLHCLLPLLVYHQLPRTQPSVTLPFAYTTATTLALLFYTTNSFSALLWLRAFLLEASLLSILCVGVLCVRLLRNGVLPPLHLPPTTRIFPTFSILLPLTHR